MRGVIRRGRNRADQSSLSGVSQSNSFSKFIKKPALSLAFLMAIFSSAFMAKQAQQLHSESPAQSELNASYSQSSDTEDAPPAPEEPSSTVANNETTNTVTTQTAIDNGKAKVSVQINGQDVPIPQEGSSSQTVTSNGNKTNIDVSINNGQSNTSTSTYGTNSSSFSTSFQSLTISGNN